MKKVISISICLTWFPIGGYRRSQYITSIGLFYKNVGILLGGSFTKLDDCPTCSVAKVWE